MTSDELNDRMPWMVIISREGDIEVTLFTEQHDALEFYNAASNQWSDSYLAHAFRAPRDWHGTP